MSKKIISLILCGILVFCSFNTCFAVSTDSAIKAVKELKALGDTKATTEVSPSSSSGYYYYYNGTSNLGYSNINLTTWAGIITGITQGVANSIKNLATIISNSGSTLDNTLYTIYTRLGNVESYVDGLEGYLYNINNALHYGQTGIGNLVNDLKTLLTTNNTSTSNISSDTSNIYSLLSNGLNIKLGSPWQPYFMPADGYNYSSSIWQYYWRRLINNDGTFSSTDYNNTNWLVMTKLMIRDMAGNIAGIGKFFICSVTDTSSVLTLYDKDLNTSNTGTGQNAKSFWYDFRALGTNISYHLSRLGYVLASDEEIEARQAAAANQDAVVDDFIKPTGNGSASASDFADVASIGGTMKDALDSNVSPNSAFTSLFSGSDAWDWFSTDTANSLDSTSNQRSSVSSTPHLDNYYSEVLENLRFK